MTKLTLKQAVLTTATCVALGASTVYAAGEAAATGDKSATTSNSAQPMTGKEKATAIGAGTGAVAGAVVGGPVGALVGAGVGGFVGHEGTDANGRVSNVPATRDGDGQVKRAQAALNERGYSLAVDGRNGPSTQGAIRSFQEKNGLTASGTLDDATLNALGVKG